jgi:protein phosphatase
MSTENTDTVEFTPPLQSMQVDVEFGAASHPGLVRPNNEDSYLVVRAWRMFETLATSLPAGSIPTTSGERAYGFAVADGIGGAAAGEVASRVALRTITQHVLETADWILRDTAAHAAKIEERLAERIAAADIAVRQYGNLHPLLSGMGTTLTVAASLGSQLFLGHVGDSRAYLQRGGELRPLTRDHTFVQTLQDAGAISQEEAAAHHLRNVLLRYLGAGNATADVHHVGLESGDQLLLCTDGLHDLVDEPAISQILQGQKSAQATCDELISAALDAGGKDNITVILARYDWKA